MWFGLLLACTLIILPFYAIKTFTRDKTSKDLGKTYEKDKISDGSGNKSLLLV